MPESNGTATAPVNRIAEPEKRYRKVCIMGKAPSSFHLAPFGDESWEVWILSNMGHRKEVPRWDVQFEVHDLELTKAKVYGDYYQWLCAQQEPKIIWLREEHTDIPQGRRLPIEKLLSLFQETLPLTARSYFTNSVSYMIAMAILEGVNEIGLFGVDMAQHGILQKSEYAHQRPSCELWVGLAAAHGIKVHIPDESDLCKCKRLYGLQSDPAFLKKIRARREELRQRAAQLARQEQEAHDQRVYIEGASENCLYVEHWEMFDRDFC